MSAVAGILRLDGNEVDRRELERMANALRAHGPDRSHIAAFGSIGFASVLMRMTPEDYSDHQPYRSANGTIITAALRLDNRDDLIRELSLNRDETLGWSDTRLLLQLWERYGDDVWVRLRGPFAAAIWSPRDGVLTLARDPVGLNVVCWYLSKRFFSFATLPKGLFALADVPRELNKEKFADFLVINHADLNTTLYRGIFRVPPASVLKIDRDGHLTETCFWTPKDVPAIRFKKDDDYAEALREVLDKAVCRQLRSIHKIGCFLSGGLDSSSIALLAAAALAKKGARLGAYTQIPRKGFAGEMPLGWYADETDRVEAIAKAATNIDVSYVRNNECDDLADIERFSAALDGPVRNPTNLGWILAILKKARADGRRVVLTGEGGNCGISWSGWSQTVDHVLGGRFLTALGQWRQFHRRYSSSAWRSFRILILDALLPDWVGRRAHLRHYPQHPEPWSLYSGISARFAEAMSIESRAKANGHDFLYRSRPGERFSSLRPVDYYGDRLAAEKAFSGIETRDPTADLDVLTFCLGVPAEQFLVEGIDRSLIRRAMWKTTPAIVLTGSQRGLQSADWHEKWAADRERLAQNLSDMARSPLAREALDLDRLNGLLARWPTSGWDSQKTIWEYQRAFSRAIAAGRFLMWFERANRIN